VIRFPSCLIALALLLPPPVQATGDPVRLYLSGSSAQDKLLQGLMRLKPDRPDAPYLCREGSLRVYTGSIDGVRQRLFSCESSGAAAGIAVGRRIEVLKSSGGSGDGIRPLVEGRSLAFLDPETLDPDSCQRSSRTLPESDLAAFTEYRDCDFRTLRRVPDAGISDLEPALFAPDASSLHILPMAQLVWGLPVTRNFRNALQALQGLVPADVAHDDARREALEIMPSLTAVQVGSIFAGTLRSWSQLYDDSGEAITRSALLAASAPADPRMSGTSPGAYRPAAEAGEHVYVCRRVASSGTQVAFSLRYLGSGCIAGAPSMLPPDDGSNADNGGNARNLLDRARPAGRVFAGRGSADVRACLDMHDAHNRWAIGMLSTENVGNNIGREYRHIRVDGVAPTLLNAHRGTWRHVSTASMQWRTPEAGESGGSGASVRVREFIARNIGLPGVLRSLNRRFLHSWGQGGYLGGGAAAALLPAQLPVTRETLRRLPLAGVGASLGERPDSCQVPLLLGPASISAEPGAY